MKTWITSDLHFSHKNILKYSPTYRQFQDVDAMNEGIVAAWNISVKPEDMVYILGDVAFCNAEKATQFMKRMNGRKILIEGNHDVKLVKDAAFRSCFEEIHKYHEITYNKTLICLFHFRIFEWNQCHRGSIQLFGHSHGNGGDTGNRSMDVGFDATGNVVSSLDSIVEKMKAKEIKTHHNGYRE